MSSKKRPQLGRKSNPLPQARGIWISRRWIPIPEQNLARAAKVAVEAISTVMIVPDVDVDEDVVGAPTDRMAQADTTTSRARITAALAVETGLNKWIAPAVLITVAPTDLADLARNPTNLAAPKS